MKTSLRDNVLNFRIDCADEAWSFAQYLVDILGLYFYDEETYKVTNNLGMRVKRIPFFKDNERNNILFDLGLLENPYKQIFKEKVNRAIWICDELSHCSFADMLCSCTKANESSKQISYISGDEEAEECNRQFRVIMNDFDAWGNINE